MSDNEESRSSSLNNLDQEINPNPYPFLSARDNCEDEEINCYNLSKRDNCCNHDFAKSLEVISKDDRPSTINKISQTYKTNNTIRNLKNEMKENIFPYLNKDKIPKIKIKDENYFESGDKIENYLKTPINKNFNDNIYNICEKCNKNNNCFYCLSCKLNLCEICAKLKVHENHINTFENLII